MTYNPTSFNDFIIDRRIMSVSPTPFRLKSGKESHLYINWRQASNDVFSLDCLADFILAFVREKGLAPDCFFGVPEGATKLGILSTYKLAKASSSLSYDSHCLPMGRGQIKEHGKLEDRYYIGLPTSQKTIVIEDVTTTGASLINCIDQLRACGVDVIGALTLTNRQEDPKALPTFFHKRYEGACEFYALTTLHDLISRYGERSQIPHDVYSHLAQEFPDLTPLLKSA